MRYSKGVLAGSMESARLLTVFSAAMITPSWICMIYLFVGKKFKSWPMVVYDENLLNTGFINEVFQNVRLMAMSPMVYCVREPQTTPFALIGGTTLTGILAAAFGICNESFLTDYARKYGLLRTSTIVVTDKYDALRGCCLRSMPAGERKLFCSRSRRRSSVRCSAWGL